MRVEIVTADFENAKHRTGILEVLDSYATDPIGGAEPLSASVRERLVPTLENHPTAIVLLALAEERAVGVAVCFLGLSTFQARPLLNIHDLAVLPQWRGKGVGSALLVAAEQHAQQQGCCKLTLEVQDENQRARSVYRRCGFEDFEIGNSGPTRFLTKSLDSPTRH